MKKYPSSAFLILLVPNLVKHLVFNDLDREILYVDIKWFKVNLREYENTLILEQNKQNENEGL